jgi:hypothetical protein
LIQRALFQRRSKLLILYIVRQIASEYTGTPSDELNGLDKNRRIRFQPEALNAIQ